MAEPSKTEQRKAEHVNIILQENVSAEYNYWNDVRLVHTALPEIDLDDVDVSVKFFGKRLEAPLIISSMTGGFGMGKEINGNLAKAAAEVGVAMGVGSQRAALEKPELEPTYAVVKDYGVPLVFANLGAPQLVPQEGKRAYGVADARKAITMIEADAIIIHLNFLQEVVQPEGDRRAKGCLPAIKALATKFPLMAKETGAGISRETAQKLKAAGARAIDVGGLGGTSFSAVEHYRARKEAASLKERLGATFWNWGSRRRHPSFWRTSACHSSPRAACGAVSTSRKGSPSGPQWRGWRSRCSRPHGCPRTPRSKSCARSSRS